MAAGGKNLLHFLLLQSLVMVALCCQCANIHPQQQFCEHDYVLEVNIISNIYSPNENEIWYTMQVINAFKGNPNNLKYRQDMGGYLLVMPTSCSVDNLKEGFFIIFGSYYDGNILTHLCDGDIESKNLSENRRSYFYKYYQLGCNCNFNDITFNQCHAKYSYADKECTWIETDDYLRCQTKYFSCKSWNNY